MFYTDTHIIYKNYYVRIYVYVKEFRLFLSVDVCRVKMEVKMITTNFMKECENCPHIEVALNTVELSAMVKVEYHHTITCERINECRDIKEHLRKEMLKNGN